MTQKTPQIPAATLALLKRALILTDSTQLSIAQLQSLQYSGLTINPQAFVGEQQERSFNNTIRTRYGRSPTLAQRRAFASGDQWGPGGIWWRGLRPATDSTITMEDIERLFVQDDRIGPALDRRVGAKLGKDPEFSAVYEEQEAGPDAPVTAETDPLLDEVNDGLGAWWRDALVHKVLKVVSRAADWAGWCPVRINIPDTFADQATYGSAKSLAEALEIIDIQAVDPVQGGALRDEHGRIAGYFYRFQDLEDGATIEKVELHTAEAIAVYRLPAVTLDLDGGPEDTDEVPSEPVQPNPAPNVLFDPRRRRRPRFQMNTLEFEHSVLSQSVIDKQGSLNEEWANLRRNSQTGAFRQYIIKNAKPMQDAQGKPMDYIFGPNIVLELYGVPELDPMNNVPNGRLNNVDVQVVEPAPPETFIKVIDELRRSLDGDFDQGWAHEMNMRVSGASKQEAREAFEKGIIMQGPALIELIRWILETVLALAAWLEGRPDKYAGITLTPRLYLEVSRGNLELFKALIPAYAAGLVSLETVVESNPGTTDVQTELDRLAVEKAEREAAAPARDQALADLMKLPATGGLPADQTVTTDQTQEVVA
jgi:hypothetical protein